MTPTFDAQCARCGQGESLHKPEIVGENRKSVQECPPLRKPVCEHGETQPHKIPRYPKFGADGRVYYVTAWCLGPAYSPGPAKPVER